MSKAGFEKQYSIGKEGEVVVAHYLSSFGYQVIDVSDDADYRRLDIDFVVIDKDGKRITLEVKTNNQMMKYQNLVLEDVFLKDFGDVKGWLHYCQADIICFYDDTCGKCYFADGEVLRAIGATRSDDYRVWYSPEDGCQTGCYLMSLANAMSIKKPQKLIVGKCNIDKNLIL